MLKDNNGYTSQFIENCDADWNLNSEFIHWLNYWMKEYLKNASKIVDLEFHEFKYLGKIMTQKEVIERIIELTDKYIDEEFCIKEDVETIDEVFDLFNLVFWNMWW